MLLAHPVTQVPLRRGTHPKVAPAPLALGTRLLNASRCGSYWYCAQAHPHQVVRAYRELTAQGFAAFVPLHRPTRQPVLAPLFGSYLFVSFDQTARAWHAIHSTKGVARLLTQGGEPAPLRPGTVEELILRTDDLGQVHDESLLRPAPGALVQAAVHGRIFEGVCQLTTKHRVTLLYECLGGTRALSVPLAAVTILD